MPKKKLKDDGLIDLTRGHKPRSFGAVKDDWETPPELFKQLSWEFGGFELDPCANDDNTLCRRHFDAEDDGLGMAWSGRVFMNPPYSNWAEWVRKAVREVKRGVCPLVVALLPADTSTKTFHSHILGKAEIRFLPTRVTYCYRKKPGPFPARFASMVVIWRRL